jgi:hypothetical protein
LSELKLILENWNKFLNESSPIDKALGKGLGLTVSMRGDNGFVVVYDAKKILDKIEFYKNNYPDKLSEPHMIMDILDGYGSIDVVAGVKFAKPRYDKGECNNSFEVTNSASKKDSKLGPAAYEAALFYLDGLSPDRMVVKPGADKVWSIYNKRADSKEVEKKPFDDIDSDQKRTPDDTSDDCVLHKGKDHLNYSYDIQSKPSGLKELEDNHVKVLATLAQLGVKQNSFLSSLSSLFDYLFSSRY